MWGRMKSVATSISRMSIGGAGREIHAVTAAPAQSRIDVMPSGFVWRDRLSSESLQSTVNRLAVSNRLPLTARPMRSVMSSSWSDAEVFGQTGVPGCEDGYI